MGLGVGLCDGSIYRSLEIDRDMSWTEDSAMELVVSPSIPG
jgi:hypothetical protein